MSKGKREARRPGSRERRRIVAQADDVFSLDDWGSPISDYPYVLSLLNYCESFDREPPVDLLNKVLAGIGAGVAIDDDVSAEEDLFEQILAPYLTVEGESWGGDSPGRSGVFQTAYLTLGHTREVRRRLATLEKAVTAWREESGLAAEIAEFERNQAKEERLKREEALRRNEEWKSKEAERVAVWEAELLRQVQQAAEACSDRPFRRLNFLVHRGVVFYLDRGWCHSLGGDPHRVAGSLEAGGVDFVRCRRKSVMGWIPHFARCFVEANSVGWDDPELEVEVDTATDEELVNEARRAWLAVREAERNARQDN